MKIEFNYNKCESLAKNKREALEAWVNQSINVTPLDYINNSVKAVCSWEGDDKIKVVLKAGAKTTTVTFKTIELIKQNPL